MKQVLDIGVQVQILQQLLDQYNACKKADLGKPSIFTQVYYWWAPEGMKDCFELRANDGHGDYHIGDTFEEATMWFIQRSRSLGIEIQQVWNRRSDDDFADFQQKYKAQED